MKKVEVLGTGCNKCKTVYELINKVAKNNNLEIEISKVEDIMQIMNYGVMLTPTIVINGKIEIVGRVPTEEEILKII